MYLLNKDTCTHSHSHWQFVQRAKTRINGEKCSREEATHFHRRSSDVEGVSSVCLSSSRLLPPPSPGTTLHILLLLHKIVSFFLRVWFFDAFFHSRLIKSVKCCLEVMFLKKKLRVSWRSKDRPFVSSDIYILCVCFKFLAFLVFCITKHQIFCENLFFILLFSPFLNWNRIIVVFSVLWLIMTITSK